MIKIAQITPSLAKGGIERVVTVLSKELERDFDVTLIVMDSFRTDYVYDGKKRELGLDWENRKLPNRLYNFISAIIRLKRLCKKEKFDIVIAHGELASFPAIIAGIDGLIVVMHEDRLAAKKDLQGRLVNKVMKYLFSKKGLEIITVSKGIAKSMISIQGMERENIRTIYNGYYIDEFISESEKEIEEYRDVFDGSRVITAVGRLINQKGHWYLLRVFAQLKKSVDSNLKLIILGEGILHDKLVTMSKNLKLKTYSAFRKDTISNSCDVYFLGFQKNPFKYIANSKLFIMPSIWEGFGNTIVEAMACGTPVMVSDCLSGPAEIVAPDFESGKVKGDYPYSKEYGVLMPPFENRFVDENEPISNVEKIWIETIKSLLNDENKLKELSIKGKKRANDFDIKHISKEWEKLIKDMVNKNG